MRNRNLWVIVGLLALVALVAVVALVMPRTAALPDENAPELVMQTSEPTSEPQPTDAPSEATDEPTASSEPAASAEPSTSAESAESTNSPAATIPAAPAQAYLLVTVGEVVYQPIPLTGEGEYTLTQQETGAENVIHVSPDGVYMKSATCDNQDCVKQGTVTLENKATRLLGNMVICLPNQVTLELYTPEEMANLLTISEGH